MAEGSGRVTYLSATDKDALEGFKLCCKLEGIIPALGLQTRSRPSWNSRRRKV